MFGNADKVSEEELPRVLDLYLERIPDLEEWVSQPEDMDKIDSEFYIIKPERIKIFDEPRFGKETWLNIGF